MAKHKAGEIGVDEYELTRGCLEVFKTWIGSDAFIDKLDADKWEAWYKEVLNSKISSAYKHKRFRCAQELRGMARYQGEDTRSSEPTSSCLSIRGVPQRGETALRQ